MSIANVTTTSIPQTSVAGTTTAAPATSGQGAFGSQLQSLLGGKSSSANGAAATAYQAQPSHGAARNAHHPRGRYASGTDADAAAGVASGEATTGAPSGGSATNGAGGAGGSSSTGQMPPGSVLLNDMMRGLQAYGETSTLA